MKILLLITGLGMGGAEKIVCELAEKLYESGQDVNIVYFIGEIKRRPIYKEIKIYKMPLKLNLSVLKTFINLKKLVDQIKPDVIHSHMFHANLIARLIKIYNSNIRIICSSHSNFEGGRVRMALYRLTENLCDIHTNVSQNAANALESAGAVKTKRIIPVHNGININKYKNLSREKEAIINEFRIPKERNIILTIGRIDTPKDYPNLINAFNLILVERKDFHLIIVGDGPQRKRIEEMVQSLNLYEYVTFTGIRNDIPEIINACDLFVSSSAWEGFGLAILEAMICNKPIVATKTDGAMELLSDAHLVECRNHVALAIKILEVFDTLEKNINYPNIDNFDWNNVIEIWEKIYDFR